MPDNAPGTLPQWIHTLASLVTLLGLPVTLVSLAGLFEVAPVTLSFPQLPWSKALALVVFFLLSVAFGKAFSAWFGYFDVTLGWSRLVSIPVMALLSVAQTFVAVEILFGAYVTGLGAGTFAVLMVLGLGLELYFLLLLRVRDVGPAIFFSSVCFVIFGYMLASEADPEPFPQANNRVQFALVFVIGMVGSLLCVFNIEEAIDRDEKTDDTA